MLDPGATVTFVAELSSGALPELYLWKPDAYRDYVNSFTLFRGVVLGVASLAAVFLTIMFVVRGRGIFPATAAFSWAVLIYLLIDFGVLGPLLEHLQRRGAAVPRRGRGRHRHDAVRLPVHLSQPPPLASALHPSGAGAGRWCSSRCSALPSSSPRSPRPWRGWCWRCSALTGFFLILLLALRGYDRAVLLVPTWIIYIAWLFYAWLVVTGQVSNDVAQPAVAGGLVLIVMLLGFTSVQHAFSEGQVSIGTLSARSSAAPWR